MWISEHEYFFIFYQRYYTIVHAHNTKKENPQCQIKQQEAGERRTMDFKKIYKENMDTSLSEY